MVMLPRLARRALASATDRESIAKYLTRQCPGGVGDDVVADGIVEGLYHEDVDVVGLVDHVLLDFQPWAPVVGKEYLHRPFHVVQCVVLPRVVRAWPQRYRCHLEENATQMAAISWQLTRAPRLDRTTVDAQAVAERDVVEREVVAFTCPQQAAGILGRMQPR